jgi:hypothetical protein
LPEQLSRLYISNGVVPPNSFARDSSTMSNKAADLDRTSKSNAAENVGAVHSKVILIRRRYPEKACSCRILRKRYHDHRSICPYFNKYPSEKSFDRNRLLR